MLSADFDPNPLSPFEDLWRLPPDTWLIVCIGGRGGGKSFEVSKFGCCEAVMFNKRVALLREQQNTISQSIMHEIKMRYNELNVITDGYFNQWFDMQEDRLKSLVDGTERIFSKGFSTASKGRTANLKSISDVDTAIIEEFEDIRNEQKFNTFADSIRKEGARIIINSNTPDKNHWFVKRYFNLVEWENPTGKPGTPGHVPEFEGYYKLVPKKLKGVKFIITTFEDNPHLSEVTKERYRAYGDWTNKDTFNPEYYCTAILGLVSEGVKGRVYKKWMPCTSKLFDALPFAAYYGLDFGWVDPVALVKIKSHNNRNWYQLKIYKSGLSNERLAQEMRDMGITKKDEIYADQAEPKSIDALIEYGFHVLPCDKGTDSIRFGVKALEEMENYATQESTDMWTEIEQYKWPVDANGEPVTGNPNPVDEFNHALDGARYGVITKRGLYRKRKLKIGNEQNVQKPGMDKLGWIEPE